MGSAKLGITKDRLKGNYGDRHFQFMPRFKFRDKIDLVENTILDGWLPKSGFINKDTKITAFGSCFASNISKSLNDDGYTVLSNYSDSIKDLQKKNSYIINFNAEMNTSFAVLQQFQWAFENKKFSKNLWLDENGEFVGYADDIRKETRDIFYNTDVFVITFGLSEVWFNKITDEVLWRAVPKRHYNSKIHGFRVSTCSENIENIDKIYSIIKKNRPDAKIIFTLSPIPLKATFRPVSCVTANCVSKSILRSAIDEIYRRYELDDNLYYWPSYEIIKELFTNPFRDTDNRHPEDQYIDIIMSLFKNYYCI